MLIPKLFEAIRLGNVKSECVLGDRIIGNRQVRLKLVAEVVDPGSNPLATHSQRNSSQSLRAVNKDVTSKDNIRAKYEARKEAQREQSNEVNYETGTKTNITASKKTKRAPRRKHPMSR